MIETSREVLIGVGVLILVLVISVVIFIRRRKRANTHAFEISDRGVKTPVTEEEKPAQTELKGRFVGFGAVAAGVFSLLGLRLWQMQLVDGEEYVAQAERNRTRKLTTSAPRGRILDRNGVELVGNRMSLVVTADAEVVDDEKLVRRLANIVGVPMQAVRRKLRDTTAGAAARRTIAYDVSMSTVAYISEHSDRFPGVYVESQPVRTYPHGSTAAHVLGYTGSITKEQLDEQRAAFELGERSPDSIRYESGDIVGKSGIEYQYESVLQGIRGERTVLVDVHGVMTGMVDEIVPVRGSDITLSLDIEVQKAVETALLESLDIAKSTGYPNVTGASAVVMDVSNGEVVAMANLPTYNPVSFIGGIGSETWDSLTSEESNNPLTNRAISGTYPAASTIKAFSIYSALEHGIIGGNESFHCPGWWTGFGDQWGKWCWLHAGHGGIDTINGIAVSCDSVFYDIAKRFANSETPEGLQATYRKWGYGERTGIDLPGEVRGRVPDAEWKYDYFKNWSEVDRKWMPGDTANLVIGQGDFLCTPLQVAVSYAGIAREGVQMTPHLLKSISASGGSGRIDHVPVERMRLELDPSHTSLIREGLKRVFDQRSLRQLFSDLDVNVEGKSGTGQVATKDDYAWFVAYMPAEDPKYVAATVIEQGGFGGTTAAPVILKTFASLLHVSIGEVDVTIDQTR